MGTISSIGNYFQLSSLLSSGSGSSAADTSASTSPVQTLAQALDAVNSTSSQSGASAYLLDLSPQAQQLLSGGTASTSSGSGSSGSFILTNAQQTAIENIVAKYKNAPFDQATFDSIQSDLQSAGLSPQTLAAQDQINSFNPTNDLLSALNGDYSNVESLGVTASGEQTKESAYLQSIVSLWKSESTTAGSASGSAASGSAANT